MCELLVQLDELLQNEDVHRASLRFIEQLEAEALRPGQNVQTQYELQAWLEQTLKYVEAVTTCELLDEPTRLYGCKFHYCKAR